ncbi:uncharacterized protein At4g15970-like isoform X2 [Typha angustifolia]
MTLMATKLTSKAKTPPPLVAFTLGAAMATVFLLFLLTASPGGGYFGRSSWSSGLQKPSSTSKLNAAKMGCNAKGGTTKMAASNETESSEDIAELLRKAAMDDNTVILTSVNEAWAAPDSLLDSFFESFRIGEQVEHFVKHLIIITMDPKAYERCKSLHPYCYPLKLEKDLSSAKSYMTKDYLDLVWQKIKLQQRILELGYNLLFTDVDVAWFRNPFEHITVAPHITTSSDFFFGNPDDLGNYPNTGLIYFKSCRKNIEVMKYWHEARSRFPKNHDQFVFNEIKHELVSKFQVRIKFLNTAYISGFCQLGKDLNKVCTVHATCCIGLENKLYDLKNVIEDWKNYTSKPVWERQLGRIKWRIPGRCIH